MRTIAIKRLLLVNNQYLQVPTCPFISRKVHYTWFRVSNGAAHQKKNVDLKTGLLLVNLIHLLIKKITLVNKIK